MAFDLAENVHIPKDVNKYLQKISAFIDVPANLIEKNVPSLLTRHYAKFQYHEQNPERIKLLTPISDQNISFSLSRLKFNHPYTLISFLNDPNHVPPTDINSILQPFCLYKNNPQCGSEKLIPLLASLFGKKPNEFLVYFQGKQINEKTIRSSWSQLFIDPNDPTSKQRVTENDMPYFFERLISNFPTENWSLNSLEDLYSLHVLSCAMKIKLILIFPPLPCKSKSTYSLCIGRQNSSYCIYVGIITKDRFFIAEPLMKEKQILLNKPNPKQTNLLKTFETMDKDFAIYYDYQNNANSTKSVTVYSGKIYELPKIDRPSIEYTKSSSDPSALNVNVRIPTFNKENKVILHSFLESICDSVTEVTRTPNEPETNNQITQMTLRNSFKLVGKSLNTYYLMSREVTEKEQTYSEFGKVTSPSQMMNVCKEIYDQGYVFDQSMAEATKISHISAFRILAGNILSKNKISIEPVIDSMFKPIFLPKTSRISLADCCNSKYAEDICTLSILRYCVGTGQEVRICDRIMGCGNLVAPNALVLPIRNSETHELTFICSNCIKKLQTRKKVKKGVEEAFSLTNNKDILIMRLSHDVKNPPDIFSYIKTYENNIRYLHEHPIGYLRQMIDMIDHAFSTLQHILVARSLIEVTNEASLSQMLGIRDGNEANIQLTRIGSPANFVPIDYDLFKNYLQNQADIQYSSSLYHFVKRNDEIIKEIDESIEKSYIDHIVEQLQRRNNKTVPSYSIQANSTDPKHLMNFQFSFDLIGDQKKKTTKYTYKLYPIDNASHLSISPVAIIKTSKNIYNIWKYDDSSIVILAYDDADTTKYTDAYVYHLNLGTVNLDYSPAFCKLENVRLSCADLCATNAQHELTVYYQNPKTQNIMTIDFHSKTIRHENHEFSQVFNCFYAFDKNLFTFGCLNTPVLVNSKNDKQIPINISPDKIAFIANPLYLLCAYSNGRVIDLNEDSSSLEEECESQDELIIKDLSIKEPLFSCIDSNNQPGITNLKRKGDDSYDVQFCKELDQLLEDFQTTLAPGTNEAFFNQYGYADDFSKPNDRDFEQKRKANLNIWNFHLTAAEFFPVLVSYESHGLQIVVTKDMEPFCPMKQNESFPSNIRSYYTRLYSHISLHHVEEVIRCHKLTVNIVSFISDIGNDETARFIDTIFGTRFAAVAQEGIYVAVRVINGIAHVITFCNCDSSNKDQLMRQLSAMYRASDYVCICTSKLINSLNFLKEWTESIPDTYALGVRQSALPTMRTFFFNSSGDLSRSKLQKYQAKYNIESEIITVPRRQSWNTREMDDLIECQDEEEEDESDLDLDDAEPNEDEIDSESHHIKQFLDTIEDMVHCLKYRKWKEDKQQNTSNPDDSNFRKPYRPENGIRFVIEQIATYLTLNEFKDFPIDTVLKYCHLQISK